MMKTITILGSTGSIGTNCLRVLEAQTNAYRPVYLTANRNVERLYEQAKLFHPRAVAILNERAAEQYRDKFRRIDVEVYSGFEGILEISRKEQVDVVVNALVGAAGLQPTLFAIERCKRLALANKESLVIGGELVMQKARKHGTEIIPIDSEHSAILQCLSGEEAHRIRCLILTASGGPFRKMAAREFPNITVKQALNHPNWDMGRKITIDSATLMNKGLEVIEAHWLFDIAASQIEVVIHPQSIIHSLVEFTDGSIKAQLGLPDMKLPIQYALSFPDRYPSDFPRLDMGSLKNLTFEPPDTNKFRCLQLSYDALESGGAAPAVLNAANEEAVNLFLGQRIRFDEIPTIVENALTSVPYNGFKDVTELLHYDQLTRQHVRNQND